MNRNELGARIDDYLRNEHDRRCRREVEELLADEDWEALSDRFYRDLEFGTGGLRGVLGGGTNRMNPYVVARATQGLAAYVRRVEPGKRHRAVIAYDSRRYSPEFAQEAATTLAANGIMVYLFRAPRPTPELSFAVRRLGATVGIVVTASHNPPEYNGYKVYWADGGQVIPPHDEGIISEVLSVRGGFPRLAYEEAVANGLVREIEEEVDGPYIDMVAAQILRPDLVREWGPKTPVVYTPLHGTGAAVLESVFARFGVPVTTVPEQRAPDGEFPTVRYPNPEEASALELAIRTGRSIGAALVMATDPDADRLGIAVPTASGDYRLVTGNQLGALLADYIFSTRTELGTMPARPAFVKTIVTSELQRRIAESFGVACFDVLTGFKYIARKIREFEEVENGYHYLFGGEESYGYLTSTEVRDKDAVAAAALTLEMACYHASRNKTLLDRLGELFRTHGFYQEEQLSKSFEGEAGMRRIAAIMNRLRQEPPLALGGLAVTRIMDYLEGTTRRAGESAVKDIALPKSNVLQFELEGGHLFSARPSGTEPKIKFYASVRAPAELAEEAAAAANRALIDRVFKDFDPVIQGTA